MLILDKQRAVARIVALAANAPAGAVGERPRTRRRVRGRQDVATFEPAPDADVAPAHLARPRRPRRQPAVRTAPV